MNYGLYLSTSGVLTAMHRMNVASNNLANVTTTGFKPDIAFTVQRDAARIEDGLFHIDSDDLLERLGAGALASPTVTNFTPAGPELTGNDLDVAILGEGFFVLGDGGEELKFTRDGRFTLDENSFLTSATTGMQVLNERDLPIRVFPGLPVSISERGEVIQGDRVFGVLQVASVPNRNDLVKIGENLFSADPAVAESRFLTGSFLEPGSVETSGSDPIKEMMAVTNAGRDIRFGTRLMQIHDHLMDRAINSFGRVV